MNKENIKQLGLSDLVRYFIRVVDKHKEIESKLLKQSFSLGLQQIQNIRKELKMWGGRLRNAKQDYCILIY